MSKLTKSVGLTVVEPSTSAHSHNSTTSDATNKCVREFYNSSDISWQAPGRKDYLIIRESTESGEKIKRTEQVRYMLMSLREAHSKFKEDNPSLKVGLSKFCELRPEHVKLFDQLPHQVCVCSCHENVRLLFIALKEYTALSSEFSGFITQITCDSSSKECMSCKCSDCKDMIDEFAPNDCSPALCYHQWRSVDNCVGLGLGLLVSASWS